MLPVQVSNHAATVALVVVCNTLDGGGSTSVGCLGGGGSVTTASNGVQLEGGGAQEDDQQQVEDGAQEGAAEVGGDAVVGGDQRVVQHIVRVALILHAWHRSRSEPWHMSQSELWHTVQHGRVKMDVEMHHQSVVSIPLRVHDQADKEQPNHTVRQALSCNALQ